MNIATQSLTVVGLRRAGPDRVTVEIGTVPVGPGGATDLPPFHTHFVEVAQADAPSLGAPVTLTFSVGA